MAAIHYKLNNAQRAATGFTDLYVVKYDNTSDLDKTGQTDNDTISVTLDDGMEIGDLVRLPVFAQIKTAFTSPAATPVDTLTVSVGITGSTASLLAASNLITTGPVSIAANVGYASGEAIAEYVWTAATNDLLADFNPDSSAKCSELSAGEVWIWADIKRTTELMGAIQA